MNQILTASQVARQLGVDPETVNRWCKAGKLKATWFMEQWAIMPEDVADFRQGLHKFNGFVKEVEWDESEWVAVTEAAGILRVANSTMVKMLADKGVGVVKHNGRAWVRRADFARITAGYKKPGRKQGAKYVSQQTVLTDRVLVSDDVAEQNRRRLERNILNARTAVRIRPDGSEEVIMRGGRDAT